MAREISPENDDGSGSMHTSTGSEGMEEEEEVKERMVNGDKQPKVDPGEGEKPKPSKDTPKEEKSSKSKKKEDKTIGTLMFVIRLVTVWLTFPLSKCYVCWRT